MADFSPESSNNPFISDPITVTEKMPKVSTEPTVSAKVEMNGESDSTALSALFDSFDPFVSCKLLFLEKCEL